MNIDAAYKIYTALRLHFTTDNFDIRNGIKPKTPKSGVKENFGKKLEQMLKQYQHDSESFIGFLVANFLNGSEWGAIFEPTGHDVYMDWKRVQESLTYNFRQDMEHLSTLVPDIEDLWMCRDNHPVILKAYCGKKCRLETLVILNKLYRFTNEVDEKLILDPVWNSVSRTIYKYSPFIKINKEKFSMIAQKAFYE
jgi:hypothetical protein